MRRIALIGARADSSRLPQKNTRSLAGKPLVVWTIEAAVQSGLFASEVWVCSDDPQVLGLCSMFVRHFRRGPSDPDERDLTWVRHVLQRIKASPEDEVWLLRPTSPFRSAETIRRASTQWEACEHRLDSLRAVRRTRETAWKQWVIEDQIVGSPGSLPYLTGVPLTGKKRLYELPTQSLTDSYIQTGAIEVFRADLPLHRANLSGDQIGLFILEYPESLDVNDGRDWDEATRAVFMVPSY